MDRCIQSLTAITADDATAGKLSIERKLEELQRKWELYKTKSANLLDKMKIRNRKDQGYIDEKTIVDAKYKEMDTAIIKAYDRIEEIEARKEVGKEVDRLKALVADSKKHIEGRFTEIRDGVAAITGVNELPNLNMYVGWLNAVKKILVHEALSAIDSWKAAAQHHERRPSQLAEPHIKMTR